MIPSPPSLVHYRVIVIVPSRPRCQGLLDDGHHLFPTLSVCLPLQHITSSVQRGIADGSCLHALTAMAIYVRDQVSTAYSREWRSVATTNRSEFAP